MTRSTLLGAAVAAGMLASAAAGPAAAASSVTFVSGLGRDTGACTRAAPCRTFRYAILQTTAGGVVAAIDRAGYGPVSITQSVSILGPGGGGAAITVNDLPGTNTAVDINAPGATVILRGLQIDGGFDGIRIAQAANVVIADSVIAGNSNLAIDTVSGLGASVVVQDTTVQNAEVDTYATNFVAKRVTISNSPGYGIFVAAGRAVLDDCTISGTPNLPIDANAGTTIIKHAALSYGMDPTGGGGGILVEQNATAYIDSTTTFANSPRGINVSGTGFSYGNNNFPDGAIGNITPIAGD